MNTTTTARVSRAVWARAARVVVATTALAAAAIPLTACDLGSNSEKVPAVTEEAAAQARQIDADAVVLIAGAHANSPAPHLTPLTTAVTTGAVAAGRPVSMVTVAGTPHLNTDLDIDLPAPTDTESGRKALIRKGLNEVADTMTAPAGTDDADLLEAVALAGADVRSRGATRPVIVIADSGLPDTGRLDMTEPGMLGADPDQTADYLESQRALPNLTGVTVILSGIGYTAAPQAPLDAPQRDRLATMWQTVFTAAGATAVHLDPTPNTRDAVATDRTVGTVEVPAPPAPPVGCTPASLVFDSQSQVSFAPDTTVLVDEQAARDALRPVVDWLTGDRARTATVRGTTADDGPLAYQKDLGIQRAQAVAALLAAEGVAADQLQAVGVGSQFPEFVPDRTPDGALLPGPAALNRSIRIDSDPNGTCH